MMDLCSFMYLRPGNVWQDFAVKRKVVKNDNGYPIESTEEAGTLTGILGEHLQMTRTERGTDGIRTSIPSHILL